RLRRPESASRCGCGCGGLTLRSFGSTRVGGPPILPAPCSTRPETSALAIELLCRKIGMTRLYHESGEAIGVTVLEAGPNPVVQKKSAAGEGYDALQLGFGERKRSRTSKALLGHFEKAKVAPKRHLHESRVAAEDAAKYEVGQDVKVDVFA